MSDLRRLRRWRPARGQTGLARLLVILMLALTLAGCQLWDRLRPVEEQSEPSSSPPPPAASQPAERAQARGLPPSSMQQVINYLDSGQWEEAEVALLSIIDERPGNRLAMRFLEQLQSDPVELMGEDYDEILVQRGDSLSVIAQREIGDAMQFFALARYNDIPAPRRMSPGIVLKIPRSLKSPPEPSPEVVAPVVEQAPVRLPGAGLTLAGRRLLDDGRDQQVISLLSAGARAGNLDAEGEEILAEAAVNRSLQLGEERQTEDGLQLLDEIDSILSPAARPLLEPGRRKLQAEILMAEGIRERRAGNLDRALSLFMEAAELNPDSSDLQSESANVREVLVMQLHDQALVHYRDQQLDDAIGLWQQVTDLDPGFEPARVYLERARALKARLDELD